MSQITSLTIVYLTIYSDANQRKHQSSASLAFVWGIHRDRWIPRTKGQLRGKCFHLMTSSCDTHLDLVLVVLCRPSNADVKKYLPKKWYNLGSHKKGNANCAISWAIMLPTSSITERRTYESTKHVFCFTQHSQNFLTSIFRKAKSNTIIENRN